ncbi:MAG: nickel-dependent hydrogenase large subunit, partial [Gammaproteobacteria bacterium]|nr:nickel-dependent hydrogenase large subunit [Gammaproteobacteria bacterium]
MNIEKKEINVPILARVEGEGALELEVLENKLKSLTLRIYEPPRLFEQFLVGRNYSDVVDIVARICGICPIAYQMSAAHAIESVFDIQPGPWVREMRRLFYCGEWIQSHSLHVHLLASPDFLNFNSALEMAKKYPNEVTRGLRIQELGHDIITLLGARSVNPVGACVGGFYKAPTMEEAKALLKKLKDAESEVADMVRWVATLPIPKFSHDITCVSLRHPDEYPFNEGHVVSNKGLDIPISEFNDHFEETHVPQSTSLHSHLNGEPYLVGPLARINNNFDLLPDKVKALVAETGVKYPSDNMFDSINARAVEIYYSVVEAIRILENYTYPD